MKDHFPGLMTASGISSPMYTSSYQVDIRGTIAYQFGAHSFGNMLPSCTYIKISQFNFERSEKLRFNISPLECAIKTNAIACQRPAQDNLPALNLVPQMFNGHGQNGTLPMWLQDSIVLCQEGHFVLNHLVCDERTTCIMNRGMFK